MARKSKFNVGILGLGIIGSRIAANLRAGGFQVYVWNRTPKPAPNFLASPAEVAGLCEVVQLVVADSTALFEIINAMGSVLTPKHTVICNATVGSEATLEAARMVEGYGAKFLDAPFTGSKEAAEKAQLIYYIGGDDDTFKRVEPVLKASSKSIVKIGETGQAATVKIATNMIAAALTQTLVEACAIVQRSGVDLNVLTKALEQHGVRSALLDAKLPKIIARDYDTHFSVKHMFKDVQLAIQAANNFDIDIPATTATAGVLYASINHGWADLDYSAIAKFYELPGDEIQIEPEPEPEPAPVETQAEPPAVAHSPEDPAPSGKNEAGGHGRRVFGVDGAEILGGGEPAATSDATPVSGEIPPPDEDATPAKTEESPEAAAGPVEMSRRPLPPIKKEKSKSWFSSRRDD